MFDTNKFPCFKFHVKFRSLSGVDPGFPIGGVPTLIGGGTNLRHRHFSVKTYVKMKEFGPVGGGHAPETFVCRSATDCDMYLWHRAARGAGPVGRTVKSGK